MSLAIGSARRPVVRVKAAWTDAWVTLERGSYSIDQVKEGTGTTLGMAILDVLRTSNVNREEGAPAEPTIGMDYFVQVGAEDIDRPATDPDRTRWLWLGVVTSQSYVHDGYEQTGTEESLIVRISYQVEGIGALFRGIVLQRTRVWASGGASIELEQPLDFNADGLGDRAITAEGDGTFAHWLTRSATCQRWTALDVLRRAIADHINATRTPTFPAFDITGQTAALGYSGSWKLAGRTLDQVLAELAGGQRGVTWTFECDPSGTGTVHIRITSGLSTAVSLPASGDIAAVSLPACDRAVEALDTGDSHWRVAVDLSTRPRHLVLAAEYRATLSLIWKPVSPASTDALERGWLSADDSKAGDSDQKYLDVFRVFRVRFDWGGSTGAGGMPTGYDRTGGIFTGNFITGGSYPALASRLDADLVTAETARTAANVAMTVAAWTGDGTASMPREMQRDQARAWVDNGSTITEITNDYQIKITNDPVPSIIIGSRAEDGAALSALLGTASGRRLIVTCTIVSPLPVLVSVEPAGATVQLRQETDYALHQVITGTRVPGGVASATKATRDDRPLMRALLAGLGPYLNRAGSANIANRLELFKADDALRPGALVKTYHDGRTDQPVDMRAVILSRTWDFTQGRYGTYLELAPPQIDPRAYL